MTALWLGIDLGTSGVKAVLLDAREGVCGTASATLAVSRPAEGWSEQDPADWIAATQAALARLDGLDRVRGVGLSGQMHGAVLLGADDRALRPAILWNDVRSHAEAAALDGDPAFRRITGNIVFPGFTAPKLAWVARHEPALFGQVATVLLPKDFLRLWLTGERLSEMSDASGTAWLDVGRRAWSAELLAATGMEPRQMPGLAEGTEIAGRVRREAAEATGIPEGVPVAGGAGDNAAAACGLGVVAAGAAFASLGTSGVLFAATDRFAPNAASAVHAFCHALPGTWHQMGVILSATDALNWWARIAGLSPEGLAAEVEARPPGDVLFLPYLSGERTPLNDAAARGQFLQLSQRTDRAAMTQALMEGVAFAFCDSRDALEAAGTRIERVTATGGGAQSGAWLAMLAGALGVPVDVPEATEGAAQGAARLARIAAEGASPAEVLTPPPIRTTIEPRHAAAYAAAHARWRAAYPALKGAFA